MTVRSVRGAGAAALLGLLGAQLPAVAPVLLVKEALPDPDGFKRKAAAQARRDRRNARRLKEGR